MYRCSAGYVAKIIRYVKPEDCLYNFRKHLTSTFPPTLLVRTDEAIE
jgi:hypothetical protein